MASGLRISLHAHAKRTLYAASMKYTAAKLTGFCSWHVLHSCCYCHCYLRGWPSTTRLEFRCRCARLSRVCLIPRYVATAASVPTAGRGCTGLCTLSCRRQLGAWRCRRWTFCSRQHHRVTLLRMKFAGAAGARRASSPQLMPAASLLALPQMRTLPPGPRLLSRSPFLLLQP
jgi:hypothetical protein